MKINTVFKIEHIYIFGSILDCSKCGANHTEYASMSRDVFYKYKKPSTVILYDKPELIEIPEHLKLKCQKCGYTWREHCKS